MGLNRFSLFLMRCKNAMEGSGHLTKLEQPDTIRKLVLKLPFNMRVRWRRLVDDVMETEARAPMFADFANFVDHEARIATNPVFGRILEDARPKLDRQETVCRNVLSQKGQGSSVLLHKLTVARIYLPVLLPLVDQPIQ